MEPLSTTLATLVGLLSIYKQERGNNAAASHRDFMEWLEAHRHDELKNLIANTYHLQSEVDQLLLEKHEVLAAKLNAIDQILALLLSKVEGFGSVVRAIYPTLEFSEHALFMLGRFAASGAKYMVVMETSTEPQYFFVGRAASQQTFSPVREEAPFFEDDLGILCRSGMLMVGDVDRHSRSFHLTRAGMAYANNLGLVEKHRQMINEEKSRQPA